MRDLAADDTSALAPVDASRLAAAASRALSDPAFTRSPTLSRLLRFLVDRTIAGDAAQLKSYTVALDGLGRDANSESPDAYARVQVGRLRKALTAYNAAATEPDQDLLLLEGGSYVVRLLVRDAARDGEAERPAVSEPASAPATIAPEPAPPRRPSPGWLLPIALVALIFAAALLAYRWYDQKMEAAWQASNFPRIAIEVQPEAARLFSSGEADVEDVELELGAAIAPYESVRSIEGRQRADFQLRVLEVRDGARSVPAVEVVSLRDQRIVWARRFDGFPADSSAALGPFARSVAFEVGRATGVVAGVSRLRSVDVETPYGCWLRFSALVQTQATYNDTVLADCAAAWHHYAPGHPLGAALHGWAETSRAAANPDRDARHRALGDVIVHLNRSALLNPRSAMLRVAVMRANAFDGRRSQVMAQGREAVELVGDNPDTRAMVGLVYAFWNVPEGYALLEQARAGTPHRTPWYGTGLAVRAMMQNRPAEMCRQLQPLDEIADEQISLRLLFAVCDARSGKVDLARSRLAGAARNGEVSAQSVGRLLDNMPLGPEVRTRMLEWLGPAMKG